MRKPLIVVYMHKMPYPMENGTNQRIIEMIRYLKKYYAFGLVIPAFHPDVQSLQNSFDFIVYGGDYRGITGTFKRYAHKIYRTALFQILFKDHLKSFQQNPLGIYNIHAAYALLQACKKYKPALVICQRVVNTILAVAIAKKHNIPTVIDMHDLYSLRPSHDSVNIPKELKDKITPQHELALLRLFDGIIAIQYEEGKVLKQHLPGKKIVVALHPATVQSVEPTHQQSLSQASLLFIGSASPHNVDAIQFFIDTQWQAVIKQMPEVRLKICGPVATQIKAHLPNIDLVGIVEHLQSYYQEASIVINPVRYGSGLKIKSIDALAYGKCLVTTPNGSEGLPYSKDVFVSVTPEKVGESIISLLTQPEQIQAYAMKAREYVKKHLTPEACYHDLLQLLEELTVTKVKQRK